MAYSPENFEALRSALEQAAKVVIAPHVTREQRQASENLFLEFRKSKSPYEFCRFLLETCKEPYVVFQAVSTLQEATLREWSLLPAGLLPELQNFLMTHIINTNATSSDKFVQRQILRTLAVLYKRSKLDSIAAVAPFGKPGAAAAAAAAASAKPAPSNLVKEIIDIFSQTSNMKLKQICIMLMVALLVEFANTDRSTKIGLSNDSHFQAKRAFELNEFKLMLVFVVETTQTLIDSLEQQQHANKNLLRMLDAESREMLLQLFSLIDAAFNWEFTSSKHALKSFLGGQIGGGGGAGIGGAQGGQSGQTPANSLLEPTPEFKEFFLNPGLVSLLFRCYELVRDDRDMSHAAIQPVIQLSTLTGPIFKDDADPSASQLLRTSFLHNFIQCFLATFSKFQLKTHEIFNLACLIENIMSHSNLKKFHEQPVQLVEAFFNFTCSFMVTCFKAENAAESAANDDAESDAKKYLESYEKVLIAWISLKEIVAASDSPATNAQLNALFKNYAQMIFNSFVQSRLSDYDGQAGAGNAQEQIQMTDDGVDCESIEDEDSDEDDLHRYREVLFAVAEFARYSLDTCLPILAKFLNEKLLKLADVLRQYHHRQLLVESHKHVAHYSPPVDLAVLEHKKNSLSEDIHWILLIAGFILFEINSDGEKPRIPDEIMAYSIECSKYVDFDLVQKLFGQLGEAQSPANAVAAAAGQPNMAVCQALIDTQLQEGDRCDPVVRIFYNAFQLCELESHMFSLNVASFISPMVASTLMWFVRGIARSYLFMQEQSYASLSPTLHVLFGYETECSLLTLNYLLKKLYTNFYVWSSENKVTSQTAKLLMEIVKHDDMCKMLLRNEQFWAISKIALANEMPWVLLPSSVKKILIKSLVLSCGNQGGGGGHSPDSNLMQLHFCSTVLEPLSHRFEALAQLQSSKNDALHRETCIKEVMSLVETLNGIIEGASKSTVKQLIPFILPRLHQGVQLLDVYHNYGEIVELILCMFNGVIEKFLPYLGQPEYTEAKNQIYHCFLCLIQVFSRHNSGKRSAEANIEEDYFNDLLLFMTLLNKLNSIEFEYIGGGEHESTGNAQIKSIDIILTALEFLIPLMNQEMLKFQPLCIEYFKLISSTAYSNSEKLFTRSIDLFSALISSIEYGLVSGSGSDIIRLSLECLIPICNYIFTAKLQLTEHGMCVRNQFKTVFDLIFKNSFEVDLFEIASNALYSLICCFQDTYTSLVNELVSQYDDNSVREKILAGFQSLTPANFTFGIEKRNRIKFNAKFNEFCVKTYGLLFIK